MFWSLGHFSSPSIDTILERDGATLEELLEEDELLQECKAQNAKLTEYLTQPETLRKLVGYVTEMPSTADTEARRFKYPFVSSEVLSCDMAAVRDALFSDPSLLKQLLALLQQPPPLAPVLAGYVCKVVVSLQKQGPESFTAFFEHSEGITVQALLPQLLAHLGSDAILQLLVALCIGEPAPSEPGAPASFTTTTREDLAAQSWLPHATLIPGAFDALASEDADVAANASQLLCSLIAASTEAPACLEEGEAGRERCAQLVASCLGKDVSDPPNLSALEVVLQLLTRQRESQAPSQVADSLLGAVEADIDRFFAAVAAPSPLPDRFARFFSSDECPSYRPRGQQRCKLLLLLEECLKSERPSLTTPLVDLGLFPIVIDLLLMPHTCNALHMRTAAILEWAIFFTGPSAALTTTVRKALISEAQLAQRLIKLVGEYAPPSAAKAAESAEPAAPAAAPAKGKPLPCCHSFVMHIGACLLSAAQREPEVRALLEEYDGWELFIAPGGPLTTWEQRMNKPLGGLAPTRGSDDNDSDDEEELDVATMERVLAATAASQRNSDLNSTSDHDDRHQDDDDEGGHSSEYLQHFADYLSNRNFLNQTSEEQASASSEQWTAEFSFPDGFESDSSGGLAQASSADGGGGAATGNLLGGGDFDDFDDDDAAGGLGGSATSRDGTGGATTAEAAAGSSSLGTPDLNSWFAGRARTEFESLSSSSASADSDDVHGWAAFDTAPVTGPAASEPQLSTESPSPAGAGDASRSGELAI